MGMTVMRADDRVPVPWRNGGGVTREIAVFPGGDDDFRWRLSIADVGVDGPFSAFPGYRRVITVLSGAGMRLTVDGVEHEVSPLVPFEFPGAALTSCVLVAGPVTDLNLIVREGDHGSVRVRELPPGQAAVPGPAAIVLLAGELSVDEVALGSPDAALIDAGTVAALRIEADARIAVIELT
jgi:environmental stress-induced protein Ves